MQNSTALPIARQPQQIPPNVTSTLFTNPGPQPIQHPPLGPSQQFTQSPAQEGPTEIQHFPTIPQNFQEPQFSKNYST